jgi:hypothetical protein
MALHIGSDPTAADLVKIRDSVAMVGRLSDSLVRLGPLRLGLDGVLSWIPGVGEIYSMAAAAFIIVQALRARVPIHVVLICAALMGCRTLISVAPLAGPAAADLFTAHRWSARLVIQAIDRRLPVADRTPGPVARWRGLFAPRGPLAV